MRLRHILVQSERPINLDLTKFAFPLIAIGSILHRISGVVIFLALPFIFYFFDQSLSSKAQFDHLVYLLNHHLLVQLFVLCFLAALFYHLFAGIKHLFADFGIGEDLVTAKWTTFLVIIFTALFVILLSFCLFL